MVAKNSWRSHRIVGGRAHSIPSMEFDRPFAAVTPTADGDVLAVLAGAERSFTASEVQVIVGRRSKEGVRRALKRLSEQGTVTITRAGNADLYALNRSHLAAGPVVELSKLRERFVVRTRELFSTWSKPSTFAALFGSAARGGMRPMSDIDLLVIRPDRVDIGDPVWLAQLDGLRRSTKDWTGNDPRVLELGEREAELEVSKATSVLSDVHRDGVLLAGDRGYLARIVKGKT